jgi:hypothetical protein
MTRLQSLVDWIKSGTIALGIFAAIFLFAHLMWIPAFYAGTRVNEYTVHVSRFSPWSNGRFFCAVVYHRDIGGLEYAADECGIPFFASFYEVNVESKTDEIFWIHDSERGDWHLRLRGDIVTMHTAGGSSVDIPRESCKEEFERAERFVKAQRVRYASLTAKLKKTDR